MGTARRSRTDDQKTSVLSWFAQQKSAATQMETKEIPMHDSSAAAPTNVPGSGSEEKHHSHWGAVYAMSLCVFAIIASEFMPVSLLTPMAADLQVSEGMVGWGIAISGLFAVLTSLSISYLAGGMNRRTLLLALAAVMGLSGGLTSLAPGYFPFMVGQALIGVVIGGFWSLSATTAMRLVPASKVPRALAIFNGGNALAAVLAAPLGSYPGSVVGVARGLFLPTPGGCPGLCLAVDQPAFPGGGETRGKAREHLRCVQEPGHRLGHGRMRILLHGAVCPVHVCTPVLGDCHPD